MTLSLRERDIRSVLLDIEGTTTPIAFVYDVLFPYARAHVHRFLSESIDSGGVRAALQLLRSEWTDEASHGRVPPDWPEGSTDPEPVSKYVAWLMDRDRKSPGLKALQGQVWEGGYRSGLLKGEVFEDVPPSMASWRRAGVGVAIYSSGSVLAQRLLFGTTRSGDLTRLISAFFDTAVGAKTSPDSYRRIAHDLNVSAERILFVSDAGLELDAAAAAGCQVALCVRPGNPPQPIARDTAIVQSLDEIVV